MPTKRKAAKKRPVAKRPAAKRARKSSRRTGNPRYDGLGVAASKVAAAGVELP